jgi:pterin-4a-carbinolamine dehydratase
MSSQAGGRKDPTAKRPTRVCDPYGQSGKPLSKLDAQGLMATLEDEWILEEEMSQQDHGGNASDDDAKDANEKQSATTTTPLSIYREYYHDNFMDGSKFVAQVAAVAHNNNHYPCIKLERRLMKREKAWRVVSVVKCFTPTLGGLSYNDFHLAMLVDVETARPEVADLILDGKASLKKHT